MSSGRIAGVACAWLLSNHETIMPSLNGSLIARLVHRSPHPRRGNTRRSSRRNIPAQYDLGNAFYAAWFDPGMTCSSGLYEHPETTLEQARTANQDMVMDPLSLTGGERVLETGRGWGGLADRPARERDCHVVGLTLSPARLDHARDHVLGRSPRDGRVPGGSSCAGGAIEI